MTKFKALFQLFFRHQRTTGRIALVAGFSFILLAASLAINRSITEEDPLPAIIDFLAAMGLGLAVPIIALVFASSTLGDLVEDETLVYLWHRPSPRWMIAVSATASSIVAALPATVIPLGLSALLASGGSIRIALSISVASALATVAYCGLFTFAGVIVRRPLIWGLLYIFVWETLLTNILPGLGRASIRSYASAIAARIADVNTTENLHSAPASIIVSLAIAVGFIGLTSWRLSRMDVA